MRRILLAILAAALPTVFNTKPLRPQPGPSFARHLPPAYLAFENPVYFPSRSYKLKAKRLRILRERGGRR